MLLLFLNGRLLSFLEELDNYVNVFAPFQLNFKASVSYDFAIFFNDYSFQKTTK